MNKPKNMDRNELLVCWHLIEEKLGDLATYIKELEQLTPQEYDEDDDSREQFENYLRVKFKLEAMLEHEKILQ